MRTLEKRISDLESTMGSAEKVEGIVVVFIKPEGDHSEPTRLCGTTASCEMSWTRREGETYEAFEARAFAEYPRTANCVPLLFQAA